MYTCWDLRIVKYLEALNRGYSNPTHPFGHFFFFFSPPPLCSILCHPNITPSIAIVFTTDVHNRIHILGIPALTSVLSQDATYNINDQAGGSRTRPKKMDLLETLER